MARDYNKLRNIGIMAHIDAGKTTISERILFYAGKTYKMGEVHDGTAVMDYLEEEQQRGITITSAATKCEWADCEINLIDTPGHVDFTAEVERSLRVLDGAVAVIDASEGVQAQTETVWRQAKKYGLPVLVFVNKMDKVGADFEMSMNSVRDKLVANPVALQYPIGEADTFKGVIDLVKMVAVYYEQQELGVSFQEMPIPEELRDMAHKWHLKLLESLAEYDEHIMDAFVHDTAVDVEILHRAIRQGTIADRIYPVMAGSALRYIGVQKLLDGVLAYLPSPKDRPTVIGHIPNKSDKEAKLECDPSLPLVAMAFKIISDKHGDLNFLRIYQGTLKSGSRVLNPSRNIKENVTRIFEMHANSRSQRDYAEAGDIVAVVGPKETWTGNTLCDTKHPVLLEAIKFPETVMSMSIEPRTAADRARLSEGLDTLRREDPTFARKFDPETGETIISGMGELHLEILKNKLTRDMKIDVRVGKPKVAYREAIMDKVECEGKFIKQTGGRGQYGHVVMSLEPVFDEEGHYRKEIEFVNMTVGGTVPREYVPAVEHGTKDAMASGRLGGYPVVGVKACLLDGSFHSVDSSELAFEQAAAIAVSNALAKANCVLLEPIMKVQVVVPESNFGVVQGMLISKRGLIVNSRSHGNMRVLDAKVPLAEMFGFSSEIRSVTAGRGSYVMEPLTYERVPEQISEKILSNVS
jgi:elongation factor G